MMAADLVARLGQLQDLAQRTEQLAPGGRGAMYLAVTAALIERHLEELRSVLAAAATMAETAAGTANNTQAPGAFQSLAAAVAAIPAGNEQPAQDALIGTLVMIAGDARLAWWAVRVLREAPADQAGAVLLPLPADELQRFATEADAYCRRQFHFLGQFVRPAVRADFIALTKQAPPAPPGPTLPAHQAEPSDN